ncbi:hypothetical protein Tsubulata_038890 [Turnera subulata]|uniref:DUF4283 domain-containing protein n=1 Tax=Turnera subulata TaxID=218843 RepID=A0A9Q0FLK4_9ROSI|nr:hypothetical protein Tsubulata_038890 [Turnera subulata]
MQWHTDAIPYRGFKLTEEEVRVQMMADRPSFTSSNQFKSHIACPWTSSVIIKALGCRFSYRVICSKIAFLWKPQGGFQVVDLDNDYFLSWATSFDVSKEPTRTMFWVQMPKILVECYRQDILTLISRHLGKPVRIDVNNLQAERAKFTCLTIEVDLSKPLLGSMEIENWWYKVCCEDIPDVCFGCGTIGHLEESWPRQRVTSTHHDEVMELVDAVRPLEVPGTSMIALKVKASGHLGL